MSAFDPRVPRPESESDPESKPRVESGSVSGSGGVRFEPEGESDSGPIPIPIPISIPSSSSSSMAGEVDRGHEADFSAGEGDATIEADLDDVFDSDSAIRLASSPPSSGSDSGAEGGARGGGGASGAAADMATDRIFDAVRAVESNLRLEMDRLRQMFDREVRAEATRERAMDRLHAELQDYKNDLLLKVTRPIFIDLIQLHDDIGKMLDTVTVAEDAGEDFKRLARMVSDVRQGIEDALYRQGVEPFRVEGDLFDPRRQRALSSVPNDDPERAKRVAARVRPGFAAGEKVLRPEIVTVYGNPGPRG